MPKCGRAPDGGTPAIHAHFVVGPHLLACDAVLIVIVAVSGVLRFRTLSGRTWPRDPLQPPNVFGHFPAELGPETRSSAMVQNAIQKLTPEANSKLRSIS